MTEAAAPAPASADTPGIEVVTHYLKDLSFETPFGPCPPEKLGEVDLKRDVRVGVTFNPSGLHEVSLALFATGTLEGRTVLLCEMTYASTVRLHLIPDLVAPQILSVNVPQLLLPMVKKVLSDNSLFAGFPPLELEDIDFMTVYQQSEAAAHASPPVTAH